MSYCTRIQNIIDEADNPDLIPGEAVSHLSGCQGCRSFADDRAKLHELMAPAARVSVPVNFNAVLNERLSRVKAQKSPWLSGRGFVRLGTATAGLAVMLLAVQYSGLLSKRPVDQGNDDKVAQIDPEPATPGQPPVIGTVSGTTPSEAAGNNRQTPASQANSTVVKPTDRTQRESPRARGGIPIFIVRDRNREVEVPMMTISVGLQQQVLNSSGRQAPRSSDITY